MEEKPGMMKLKPGIYRHFKGNEYRLLYTAKHSETLEDMVVYQALYDERGIWVRPPPCGRRKWGGTATAAPASSGSGRRNRHR